MKDQVSVEVMVQRFCEVMDEISRDTYAKLYPEYPEVKPVTFIFERGNRYFKILDKENDECKCVRVFAFVDRDTGDIYKPASFKAPAKGVRFNIYKDFAKLQKTADIYGGFLYKR